MKNNQHYFKISQQNQENKLDDFYIFDEKHKDLEKYKKRTAEIKNILITIKTLENKKEQAKVIDKYYQELQNILGVFSNCSEFVCFVNACDNTLNAVRKDLTLTKDIAKKYFSKRLLSEFVPEEWIQAILDLGASRCKGKSGELKLISNLENLDFAEVKTWDDFTQSKKCVAQFSKIFNVKSVKKNLEIKLKTKKQGKKLDLIIKYQNKVFILEAKHLNTSGGAQDKQLSELIEILSLKETNPKIHYISFLDGSYSNKFLSDSIVHTGKRKTQRQEIKKYLKQNPKNYWLNTVGFEALFSDLIK